MKSVLWVVEVYWSDAWEGAHFVETRAFARKIAQSIRLVSGRETRIVKYVRAA